MKIVLCVLTALLSVVPVSAAAHPVHRETPPWQQASSWPDRIIVNPGTDPARSFSVTWRTDESVGKTVAQIAVATSDARFDLGAQTEAAKTERLELTEFLGPDGTIEILENMGLPPAHYHSVTFDELAPDTLYAYRVRGHRGHWSAWRQVRTAPTSGPLRFVFFGDAQTAIRSHITRSFDTAARVFPDPHFAIHGGDLVNTAVYDKEWAEWFEAMGRTAVTVPSIPVTGNHDYVNFDKDKARDGDGKLFIARKSVSPLWRRQFTLGEEENLPPDLRETVYDVKYGNQLHVFVLDSSGVAWGEQLAWLETKLSASTAAFTLVTMHHPIFSFVGGREHPAARKRRSALLDVLREGNVDLVLTGHRHTYQRSAYGNDVARFSAGEEAEVETVFITTASSTKRGRSKVDGWERYEEEQGGDFSLTRYGDNTPIFGVFEVDGGALHYRAIDSVGELYDAFTMRKNGDGTLLVTNDPIVASGPKTYDNTGPYRPWDDLR